VLRASNSEKLMLTAAHVVGSLSAAHALDERHVLLRTGIGATSSGDPVIGEVIESHPPEPCTTVELDACLVRVHDHVSLGQVVRERITSGRARDLRGFEDLVPVFKRGINTPSLTAGLLDPTPVIGRTKLLQPPGPPIVREYQNGWYVEGDGEPFAKLGDSGSIVVDEDDCVVAMIVAVRSDRPFAPAPEDPAFVVPIFDILNGLDVRLAGPDRACIRH
jgi:hypothetical protein